MINEILWNLINNGEVASLINDIIVGTEEKKGHDEVVEEIIEEISKEAGREWFVYKTRKI